MSILKDLEHIARRVENELAAIGTDLEKDLSAATQTVEAGLEDAKTFLVQGFSTAEKAIIEKEIDRVKKDYQEGLALLRTVWQNSVRAADTDSIRNDVTTLFKSSGSDADAAASGLFSLVTNDAVRGSYNAIMKAGFDSVSVGAIGELDLGVGVASSGGLGVIITHIPKFDPRVLADFAVSSGVEEGIAGGAFLAFWVHRPSELQGAFLATKVEGVIEAGLGLIFFFDVSLKPGFIGAAIAVSGGEEIEAGVELGFTLAFRPKSVASLAMSAV